MNGKKIGIDPPGKIRRDWHGSLRLAARHWNISKRSNRKSA
jgi:hypothetical protein